MTYIVKTYDFHAAILAGQSEDISIIHSEHITDNQSLVFSTSGNFICETFESSTGVIYTKVYELVKG